MSSATTLPGRLQGQIAGVTASQRSMAGWRHVLTLTLALKPDVHACRAEVRSPTLVLSAEVDP